MTSLAELARIEHPLEAVMHVAGILLPATMLGYFIVRGITSVDGVPFSRLQTQPWLVVVLVVAWLAFAATVVLSVVERAADPH